jgi:hypothetical protein
LAGATDENKGPSTQAVGFFPGMGVFGMHGPVKLSFGTSVCRSTTVSIGVDLEKHRKLISTTNFSFLISSTAVDDLYKAKQKIFIK